MFLPAFIHAKFEKHFLVFTADGQELNVPTQKLLKLDPSGLRDLDDMISAPELSEPALLHNIRQRYRNDKFYVI